MYTDKRVLLIAGGGTLGTKVAEELLRKGAWVEIICPEEKRSNHPRLSFHRSLATEELLRELFSQRHYDGIVNFIHYKKAEDYKKIYPLLIGNTDHLIFLSSYRVYANEQHPITEEAPRLYDVVKDPEFLEQEDYAVPKSQCEDFLRGKHAGDPWTIVRPVISFSDRRLDLLMYSGDQVTAAAKAGTELLLPELTRNFKAGLDWAGNSGKLIANLLFKPEAMGESFTIYSGHGMTWGEVAAVYQKLTGLKVRWCSEEEYLNFHESVKSNPNTNWRWRFDRRYDRDIDCSKVLQVTGLTQADFTSVDEGIRIELDNLARSEQGHSMEKVRIAQIGTSRYGHSVAVWKSLKKQPDIFEIAGYAFPENEEERFPKALPHYEGFRKLTVEEILNDPTITAVAVETEEVNLTRYALQAARAGKHIHMEKPGGLSLSDFRELIEIMKETGKVFHVGYMYRYNPVVMELMERIRRGELGQILNVEAQMNCIHPVELRQWLKGFPGGMMFYLGCHLVDLILRIQGQPKQIIPLNRSSGCGTDAEDMAMAVFDYGNGISFAKASAMEIGGYARRQLVVVGTKATVELKPLEMTLTDVDLYTGKTEYTERAWSDMGRYQRSDGYDRYDGMMAAFAAYVRGERENPYTLEHELAVYQTLLKASGV